MISIRSHSFLVLAALAASPASAALTYELRAPGLNGRELTLPASGGTFTLQLYANITDTPLSEGLGLATVNLFSRPIDGGVATGGGVTNFSLDPAGTRNLGSNGGAQNGANPAPGDLVPSYTNDGILDWGTAENFGASPSTSTPTQPGSRAKYNRSISYLATDNTQTSGAFYTIGNQILIGTFTLNFSAADVKAVALDTARTRFQVDLVRRTSASAPGTTQWIENVATPATVVPGPTTGRFSSSTVSGLNGANETSQNIGFADSPLAYVDFKLGTSTPPPPVATFVDLVADGATSGLPFRAFSALSTFGGVNVSLEVPIGGATEGYVEILANGQNVAPGTPTYVAFDLIGDALPANFSIVGGIDVTASLLGSVEGQWGSEYDFVFQFNQVGPDILFDFDTVGVNRLVTFTSGTNGIFIPEPSTLALLALPALLTMRRQKTHRTSDHTSR